MNTFGDRLRELRKSLGKSQKDFGKIFGLSESAIGMYERNERKPDYETLEKFADFLDTSINYLITGKREEDKKVSVAGQEIKLSPDELRIFEELKKHPILFNDLASDPEKKIKELIKLYKMKKMFLDEDDEENEDGFGELED